MQKIYVLFIATFLFLAGCGGDGGGTNSGSSGATTYKVRLATQGTLTAGPLTGIDVTLQLPTGVTPKLAVDGVVGSSVVKASGVLVDNASQNIQTYYTPASGTKAGTLNILLTSTAANGFGIGEFATVTLNKAARDVNFATVNQNVADGTTLAVVKEYIVKSSTAVFMNYSTAVNSVSIKITAEAI